MMALRSQRPICRTQRLARRLQKIPSFLMSSRAFFGLSETGKTYFLPAQQALEKASLYGLSLEPSVRCTERSALVYAQALGSLPNLSAEAHSIHLLLVARENTIATS